MTRQLDRDQPGRLMLSIDVGGSHTGIRVEDQNQSRSFTERTAPSVRTSRGTPDMRALVNLVEATLARAELPIHALDTCAIGAASVGVIRGDIQPLLAWARNARLRRVALTCDATTAYLGAIGDEPGAVIVCGTGVIAMGRSRTGTWKRVDGWGHLLGDDGGGAWIGARGLRSALRAADGRPHGSVALLTALSSRHGTPAELVTAIYADPNPARLLASFAPAVIEAAAGGDPVARRIRADAVGHLANTVTTVLAADTPEVRYLGGLFNAGAAITAPFEQAVWLRRPDARICPASGDALDGAAILARYIADAREPLTFPDVTTYEFSGTVMSAVSRTESVWP